jgi:iron(III) transport system ATP-binding protein
MPGITLRGLAKRYGDFAAVDDLSLDVRAGELVALLGPSGCGKTTTLRLVAGFLKPEAGEIRVGDRLLSSPAAVVPPERRRMAMIFQSYALWPHMTVAQNVG